MWMKIARGLSVVVVLTAGATTLAAPQEHPGQMTRARVWVENRSIDEAVPISLIRVATPTPISVQLSGVPTVAIASSSTVQARFVRQTWEYRAVTITAGQEAAAALTQAGADGWDTTGIQLPTQTGMTLVLKRPR